MFNSALEVQKFIGAKIKTVSGIWGEIKGVVKDKEDGVFWAHFEDMILMSDLVFCRSWTSVNLERLYNPILFNPLREQELLKTHRELREEQGIAHPVDSVNKEAKRANKVFAPLILP